MAKTKAQPVKKYLVKKQWNPDYNGSPGEVNNGISKTVPDMSLSVRTLMMNHTRDYTEREPLYFDTEIPKFDDITDAMKWKQDLDEKKAAVNETIQDMNRQKAKEIADQKEAERKAKFRELKQKDLLRRTPKPE